MASTIISIFVGGAITWLVSHYYYRRASQELIKETVQLRQLNNLMLRGMEKAGWIVFNRDEGGNPNGIRFEKSVGGTLHLRGKLTPDPIIDETTSERSRLGTERHG